MITKDTVFILGAGASAPYEYPTGEALRNDICRNFTKRIKFIANKVSKSSLYEGELSEIVLPKAHSFCDAFFKSSTPSIDLFLARNPDFSEIGKMAIVSSILEAEKSSLFREDMKDKTKDWYSLLFRKLTDNLLDPESYKRFHENRVAFITFNYDRSLEHFLYESLSNSFGSARKDEIVNQLEKIHIYHVYGIVDKLPWQGGDTNYMGHSDNYSLPLIDELKNNITLIHERSKSDVQAIQNAMINSSRVYFLGFKYAKENCDALDITKVLEGRQEIYGTALNMSEKERSKIFHYLRGGFREKSANPNDPKLEPWDCYRLLDEYL